MERLLDITTAFVLAALLTWGLLEYLTL